MPIGTITVDARNRTFALQQKRQKATKHKTVPSEARRGNDISRVYWQNLPQLRVRSHGPRETDDDASTIYSTRGL